MSARVSKAGVGQVGWEFPTSEGTLDFSLTVLLTCSFLAAGRGVISQLPVVRPRKTQPAQVGAGASAARTGPEPPHQRHRHCPFLGGFSRAPLPRGSWRRNPTPSPHPRCPDCPEGSGCAWGELAFSPAWPMGPGKGPLLAEGSAFRGVRGASAGRQAVRASRAWPPVRCLGALLSDTLQAPAFLDSLVEGGEGREKKGREASITCLSNTPTWGPGPQPRQVP